MVLSPETNSNSLPVQKEDQQEILEDNEDVLILNENDFRIYKEEESKCTGFTLKGKPCKNKICKASNDLKYCKMHLKKFRLEKPEECPICTESLENEHVPLSCCHWVHRECVVNWGKDQCPVCRAKIKLTSKEWKKIEMNRKPPEDDGDFGGYEDEIEYPPQFFEYLSSIIRTVSENFTDSDIDERVFQQFFIIDMGS